VRCPHWVGHSQKAILCEWLIPKARLILKFDRQEDKGIQFHTFCEGRYERCEVCKLLDQYDDEEID